MENTMDFVSLCSFTTIMKGSETGQKFTYLIQSKKNYRTMKKTNMLIGHLKDFVL